MSKQIEIMKIAFNANLHTFISKNKDKYIISDYNQNIFSITEVFEINFENFCENNFNYRTGVGSYADDNIFYDNDYEGKNGSHAYKILNDFLNDFNQYCTGINFFGEIERKICTVDEIVQIFNDMNHWIFESIDSKFDFTMIEDFGQRLEEFDVKILFNTKEEFCIVVDFLKEGVKLTFELKDQKYSVSYPKILGLEFFYF